MEVRAPIWSEHGPLIFIGFSKLQFIQPPPWIFPIHIALLRAAEPLEAGVTRGKYPFTQSVCGLLLSTLPPPRSCPWLVLVLLIHWNVGLLSSLPAASQKHHSLPKNRDPLAGTVALDPQTFLTLLNECRNCLASLCMLWSWGAFEGVGAYLLSESSPPASQSAAEFYNIFYLYEDSSNSSGQEGAWLKIKEYNISDVLCSQLSMGDLGIKLIFQLLGKINNK